MYVAVQWCVRRWCTLLWLTPYSHGCGWLSFAYRSQMPILYLHLNASEAREHRTSKIPPVYSLYLLSLSPAPIVLFFLHRPLCFELFRVRIYLYAVYIPPGTLLVEPSLNPVLQSQSSQSPFRTSNGSRAHVAHPREGFGIRVATFFYIHNLLQRLSWALHQG